MSDAALKSQIRAMAEAHGFALCQFTRPRLSGPHAGALDAWMAAGMQGEMAWMGEVVRTARRKDPASLLDGVRTVITVAMRYTPPGEVPANAACGVISVYAHGEDYHDVMKKRLRTFALELDELLGTHDQRIFIDTAPVLEHALAADAGLGWQGKHTLTIHRELGSWLLLGEIFTTAELSPDEPASHHCGSCTACIDGCPTAAIVAPYVVDARRCISYLTIEFDGFIDPELRPLMGNRIYGCDDCQALCPWNRKPSAPETDLLNPDGENLMPELASLLALDEAGFRARFRKSPIRRSKRRGLLRNVCIAMGNSGHDGFIEPLMASLTDEEPLIRGHAAWALAELVAAGRESVQAALEQALAAETVAEVQDEISRAIRRIRMES